MRKATETSMGSAPSAAALRSFATTRHDALSRQYAGKCCSISSRTSASVTSFMTSGMTSGRGSGRNQFGLGRGHSYATQTPARPENRPNRPAGRATDRRSDPFHPATAPHRASLFSSPLAGPVPPQSTLGERHAGVILHDEAGVRFLRNYVAVSPSVNRLRRSARHNRLCCSYFWFHLHAPDGTGAGLDRVHSATTRRGKHRENHTDGGSHRQHHHQGQDRAGHREVPASAAVASSWVGWPLISVHPTGPWISALRAGRDLSSAGMMLPRVPLLFGLACDRWHRPGS